ncbi:MAG: 50S ribosomal protein L32 [Planctomycetota bacterium]
MQPVTRKSKSRTRTRRAHHALRAAQLIACPQCGQAKLPHRACANCGYLNSRTRVKAGAEEPKAKK